jgi:hypothetical protein
MLRSTDAITTSICTCCTPPIWMALMTLFACAPTALFASRSMIATSAGVVA